MLRRDDAIARPGANVVYCVGDSFTYGQGVRRDEAWPQVLAGMLRSAGGDQAPEVRTLAKPGDSSSVALIEVANALKAGNARAILIMAGWNANDGDFAAWAASHRRAVPWTARADVVLDHSRLYRVVKQALTYRGRALVVDDIEVVPQTTAMTLYDFRAYQEIALANLTKVARLCRAAGVPCALLTYPHQDLPANPYTRTEYYHALFGRTPITEDMYLIHDRRPDEIAIDAVIRRVGEREGLPVVDLQPAFASAQRTDLYQADWHHPTAAGHAIIARTVFDAFGERLLGRKSG